MTAWPGDFVELKVPDEFAGEEVLIEPRIDSKLNTKSTMTKLWPEPQLVTGRIPNSLTGPISVQKESSMSNCEKCSKVGYGNRRDNN